MSNFEVNLTSTDYQQNFNYIVEFLEKTNQGSGINFRDAAYKPFIQIITILYTYISIQSGMNISELMLKTAEMEENIFRRLSDFNFIPRLKSPGNGYLNFKLNQLFDDEELILYFDKLMYNDNTQLNYSYHFSDEFDSSRTVRLKKTIDGYEAVFPVYEGVLKTQDIEVDNEFPQIIYLSDYDDKDSIIESKIQVYVKDSLSSFEKYAPLRSGNLNSDKNYLLEYDKELGLMIRFNIDNVSRTILPGETIRVEYVLTKGADINEENGIVEWNSDNLEMLRNCSIVDLNSNVLFVTDEEGVITYGAALAEDVDIFLTDTAESDYPIVISNGLDVQSIQSMKDLAPLLRNTLERAVINEDFEALLKKIVNFDFVKAWSGGEEVIDLNAILDAVDFVPTDPKTDAKLLFKRLIGSLSSESFNSNNAFINQVTQADINNGEIVFDKGFVYMMLGNYFTFPTIDTDEINAYFDNYKFPNIGLKFITPTYGLLKLSMILKINPGFVNSFNVKDFKTSMKNEINVFIRKFGYFNYSQISNLIEKNEKVDYIESLEFKTSVKGYNFPNSSNQWKCIRLFNEIKEDIPEQFVGLDVFKTEGNNVIVNSEIVGTINKTTGMMKFNHSFMGETGLLKSFTIQNVTFKYNKITQFKEAVFGVENDNDIVLIVK